MSVYGGNSSVFSVNEMTKSIALRKKLFDRKEFVAHNYDMGAFLNQL
jgi:hypothetical protein